MYINYNELKKFFIEILEKYNNNDLSGLYYCIENCVFLENILSITDVSVDKDNYNLIVADNYIGSMKSDLYYDINNNKTKLNILKYVLYKDFNLVLDFLNNLININNYILKNDDNADIIVKRDVEKKDEDFENVNSIISKSNCDIKYHIYSSDILIGEFKYNGYFYTLNNNSIKTDNIKMEDKNIMINDMYYYNNLYYQNIIKNRVKTKIK